MCPEKNILAINSWQVIWGLILTNGSLKVTKAQYQSMRMIADTFRRLEIGNLSAVAIEDEIMSPSRGKLLSLPHYNTLFKKYKPILYSRLAVRGRSTLETVSMRKAGARARRFSPSGEALAPVHTIVPSE